MLECKNVKSFINVLIWEHVKIFCLVGGWVVVVVGGGVEVRSGGDVDAGVCVCL